MLHCANGSVINHWLSCHDGRLIVGCLAALVGIARVTGSQMDSVASFLNAHVLWLFSLGVLSLRKVERSVTSRKSHTTTTFTLLRLTTVYDAAEQNLSPYIRNIKVAD